MAQAVHSCPSCNTLNTSVLNETTLLICKSCGGIVLQKAKGSNNISPSPVPPDWSFLQLNTIGQFGDHSFTIVGRVRLQLRNDYKNFWCAARPDGRKLWIMESFASFSLLNPSWLPFTQDIRTLRAGVDVTLKGGLKLTGEYVEKCEGVSYEGEIGGWDTFVNGFFFIQASNRSHQTAVFLIVGKESASYLTGEKIEFEKLNLKNIVQWDEWK